MSIVKTHDLKTGMTLAKEVQNLSNRILLPEGTVLTEKHILNLKAWGITDAEVQEEGVVFDSTPEAVNVDRQKQAMANKEVADLFDLSNKDHPAIAELMRLSILNRIKKMPGMGHINVK